MAALGSKLGKLSLAILEHIVEGALGKKFVEELYEPTKETLALEAALTQAERRFTEEFSDAVFAAHMFADVNEQNVARFIDVVERFYQQPGESSFRNNLNKILVESFPNIDGKLLAYASELYVDILTEQIALVDPDFREKVRALSDLRSHKILRSVEALLAQQAKFGIGGSVGGNVVIGDGNSINMSAAQQVFRSLHQLPAPPADFKGRDELIKQLVADLKHGDGATITGKPIQGLIGMGGIGKTALGLVVADQVKHEYPDAQIFLDLRGTTEPLPPLEIMRHVVLTFEPKADLRALGEAEMQGAYRSVLHEKKALLFFDNARSAEQVAPLRPPETCAMLVTSRWNFAVPGLQKRQLNVMQPEDAKAFLLEICPHIGEKAAELAKACGCLPLALRIAGSFLQVNEGWDVSKYLAQLNDRKSRLFALQQSHADAELKAEPELLASFEGSYNQLSQEDQERWRKLGVFPTTFDANAAKAMWGLADEETMRLAGLLTRYSLLDYHPTINRYSLHDLLADYARMQMAQGEEFETRLQHALYYKDVLMVSRDLYLKGGENVLTGLRLFDLEWENIRAGQASAAAARSENSDVVRLCMEYPNAGVYVLSLRLHTKERIKWLEAALVAARKLGSKAHEGAAMGNLGLAYADLGEMRKAIEYHEQNLVIDREIGDRRGEANSLGNLGLAYHEFGETRKAIGFYEGQLVITREIGDRRGEGRALNNLGLAYADLGETRKAIEFYEQRLVIAREIGDRRGEGAALGNLGSAYADLGETHKAIEFYEGQLAITREIGDRRGEGIALFNTGLALYELEEKDRAIELVKQALEIYEAIEDPNAAWARNKLKEWGAIG